MLFSLSSHVGHFLDYIVKIMQLKTLTFPFQDAVLGPWYFIAYSTVSLAELAAWMFFRDGYSEDHVYQETVY